MKSLDQLAATVTDPLMGLDSRSKGLFVGGLYSPKLAKAPKGHVDIATFRKVNQISYEPVHHNSHSTQSKQKQKKGEEVLKKHQVVLAGDGDMCLKENNSKIKSTWKRRQIPNLDTRSRNNKEETALGGYKHALQLEETEVSKRICMGYQ